MRGRDTGKLGCRGVEPATPPHVDTTMVVRLRKNLEVISFPLYFETMRLYIKQLCDDQRSVYHVNVLHCFHTRRMMPRSIRNFAVQQGADTIYSLSTMLPPSDAGDWSG